MLDKLEDYILKYHKTELSLISDNPQPNDFIIIDCKTLFEELGHEIIDTLLDSPLDLITDIRRVIIRHTNNLEVFISFKNIPLEQKNEIWKVHNKQINRFVVFESYIRTITQRYPIIDKMSLECPSCANIINVTCTDGKRPNDIRCYCKYKGKFKVVAESYFDRQKVLLEDPKDEITEKSRSIVGYLDRAMTRVAVDQELMEGKKVLVYGILCVEKNEDSKKDVYYIKINNIKVIEQGFDKVKIDVQDECFIKQEVKKPEFIENLKSSVVPYHSGDSEVKEGIVLSLAGSRKVIVNGIMRDTGNINILLCGDPGSGKSKLIRTCVKISPIHKYSSCTGATAVGLTAAFVKRDELLKESVIKPGILPMCHKGFCALDEIDKIPPEELNKINTTLSELITTADKGGISIQFQSDVTIMAAMNPLNREFEFTNSYKSLEDQINLPKDLKDRFTLIFAMARRRDDNIARIMLKPYHTDKPFDDQHNVEDKPYSNSFLTKYFAFIRRFDPIIDVDTALYIQDYEKKINSKSNERFSNRLFYAIINLSIAYARLELLNVNKNHVDKAVNLLMYTFKERGLLSVEGFLKFEVLEGILTPEEKTKKRNLHHTIIDYCEQAGKVGIKHEELYSKCKSEIDFNNTEFDEAIQSIKKEGMLFENPRGVYKLL